VRQVQKQNKSNKVISENMNCRTLTNATFVPPPLPEMKEALHNLDLEKFWHDSHTLPYLRDKRDLILELVTQHGAYNIRVFGSVA
jgi:hypothetical protein